MSITVKELSKAYGGQKALDAISFEINTGEIVGLLGPNGAGKTTLMKIISCLLPQKSGQVWVNGLNTLHNSIEIRKNTGYLPEHNPLYPDMYVLEYLEFCAGIHKLPLNTRKKRIGEMLEVTGLHREQKKKIGALSKGYRQRVGLAQALIHDPKVLILDEPTSGLDPNQLVEIRNLLRETGRKKTLILSTHILQELEAICDRAIIINKGNIIADGAIEELTKLKAGKVLILVEFSSKTNAELLQNIPGTLSVKNTNANTWAIESVTDKDIRPEIFNFAVQNQLTVLSLNREEQSLEKIFQQLTQENKS